MVARLFPDYEELFRRRNWKMLPQIDRVYVNQKARTALGWEPKYDFHFALDRLVTGQDFRSELTHTVGSKGYHAEVFENGPYPVTD